MSHPRSLLLRPLRRLLTPYQQTRFARHHAPFIRRLQTPSTPILTKYKAALDRKLQKEGHSSYDELRQAYADKIAAVKKEASIPEIDAVLKATQEAENAFTAPVSSGLQDPPPPPPSPLGDAVRNVTTPAALKSLASFMDVDALRAHNDAKEIELLWRARFLKSPTSLCAVVPSSTFSTIASRARQHPMFILPLPREGQGTEFQFLQWTFPTRESATVMFTSLADYKLKGEFAVPHTTVTHHTELADEKGVVLAQGNVLPDRGVSVQQAGLLVVWLQKFYAGQGKRGELLEMFSRGDGGFRVEDVVQEVEKID